MTTINNPGTAPVRGAGYKVDISRGQRIGRVSSEWFSRPDDERFLSLSELHAAVEGRARRATTRTVETREVRVEASRDDPERLALLLPGRGEPVTPTHWSFGQLASLVGAPSGYLRQLPAPLAGINLQHGLLSHRGELMKTLETEDGRTELRAVTGPDYGRIWDHELVAAVMKIAGNGTGDTRWKVPGLLDWSSMTHNPLVEVTRDNTTLYASDRDVFLFLVDDMHPIEAGRLPSGEPVRLRDTQDGTGRAGKWTDAQSGDHGDLLDILRAATPTGSMRDAMAEARHFLGQQDCGPESSPPTGRAARARAGPPGAARRLLAMATPIAGTPGQAILDAGKRKWSDFKPGKRGIVEAITIRNLCAHGIPVFNRKAVNRIAAASSAKCKIKEGDAILLDKQRFTVHTATLRGFSRMLADAVSALPDVKP